MYFFVSFTVILVHAVPASTRKLVAVHHTLAKGGGDG